MKKNVVFATFTPDGVPCLNCYSFSRKGIKAILKERKQNGHAFLGEKIYKLPLGAYNKLISFANCKPIC